MAYSDAGSHPVCVSMKLNTNKLTGQPLLSFLYHVIPWTFGFVCLSSVSVIDGYFLGNFVGEDALAVVNLSIPVITLITSLEIMVAAGASVRALSWKRGYRQCITPVQSVHFGRLSGSSHTLVAGFYFFGSGRVIPGCKRSTCATIA